MPVLAFLRRLNRALVKASSWGTIAAIAAIAVIIPYAVFSRYVLKDTPSWSDEAALFSLVWASMLGAVVGLQRGYQVGIEYFLVKTPKAVSAFLRVLGFVLMLAFFALSIAYGYRQASFNMRQLSPAMQLPMGIPYAAIPLGFLLMLFITLENLLAFLLGAETPKRVEDEAESGRGGIQ